MEPMRDLMARHLELSSDAWAEKAMAEAVLRSQAGQPMGRELRVTIAATLRLEKQCLVQVSLLLREARLWAGLPETSLTVGQRCLAYRMLSRTGCCVEELLRSEHRRFPVALFRLLATPDRATAMELQAAPQCVRDPWGHEFLETYADPLCGEALAVLVSVASLLKLDIAEIECRHAAIRRHLHTRVQTHVMGFGDLSGLWMAQQARSQAAAAEVGAIGLKLRPRQAASTGSANLKRQRPQKRKRAKTGGGGGAHRAFFSEQLRLRGLRLQGPGVAAMLWAEYARLTEEERAAYMEKGAVATERSQQPRNPKKNSFGLVRRRRDAVAHAQNQQRRAFWQRLQGLPDSEQLDLLVETALPQASSGEDYLVALGRAKHLAKQGHEATRAQHQKHQQAVAQWQQENGGPMAMELLRALGLPQDRANVIARHMRAEPTEHCTVLKFSPDIAGVAAELTGALHHGQEWSKVRQSMEEDSTVKTA